MLEEVGEPYELIEKSTRTDELQSIEYLRLNPNARIPTLVDGDAVLWESMAINLYLAQKYEGPMHCAEPKVLGLAAQWSFWAILEMEGLLLDCCNIAHSCLNLRVMPHTRSVMNYCYESRWKYSTTLYVDATTSQTATLRLPTSMWRASLSGEKWGA
jgi:glutathione S-transferase